MTVHPLLINLALAINLCHFSTEVLYIIARSCWQGRVKQACNYLGNLSHHHALSLLPGQFTREEINSEEIINLWLFRQLSQSNVFAWIIQRCFKFLFCFANWKLTLILKKNGLRQQVAWEIPVQTFILGTFLGSWFHYIFITWIKHLTSGTSLGSSG